MRRTEICQAERIAGYAAGYNDVDVFRIYDGNLSSRFEGFFYHRQSFFRDRVMSKEYVNVGRFGVHPIVYALYFPFSEFFVRYLCALVDVIPQALFAFKAPTMQHDSQFRVHYDDVFSEMSEGIRHPDFVLSKRAAVSGNIHSLFR